MNKVAAAGIPVIATTIPVIASARQAIGSRHCERSAAIHEP